MSRLGVDQDLKEEWTLGGSVSDTRFILGPNHELKVSSVQKLVPAGQRITLKPILDLKRKVDDTVGSGPGRYKCHQDRTQTDFDFHTNPVHPVQEIRSYPRLEAAENVTMVGCLYGLPVSPPVNESCYYVWTCTGKERAVGNPAEATPGPKKNEVKVLTELVPCGIDPLGLFLILKREHAHILDQINVLLEALPENFLDSIDPVIMVRIDHDPIKTYLHSEGELVEVQHQPIPSEEIEEQIQVVRVRGHLTINCPQTEPDIQNSIKHLMEKVGSPYGTFHLENSDVIFLHSWTSRKKFSGMGWAGNETLSTPDDEGCEVTNLDDDAEVVPDLWRHLKEEVIDDGFGPVSDKEKPKQVEEKETLTFRLYMKMSGDACSSKTLNCSPVFHYEKKDFKNVQIPLIIDTVGVARKQLKIPELMELLKGTVQRQIYEMGRSVISELKTRGTTSLPVAFHFKPQALGHLCSIVYNERATCANFAEFRKHIHGLFLLPLDRPIFRRMNQYCFQDALPKSGPLQNVHEGLKSGSSTGGKVYLVQGTYSYHHYMQDKFNDDGWGCAYRSLQTLVSWFRHQGYTGTAIPTHGQIQKCLVDMGDKEKKFLDSKQWIGSTEVGYVLEKTCDVQAKFLSVSSGEEMATKGRDLAHHFELQGTPVMIGGGVLAHTILGVDWNEDTGDIKWLILDPHYTGSDWTTNGTPNVGHMQQKGWIGWKGPDFWKKDAFYNMCMPLKPAQW
eukprot:maker-scaffold190_size271632-snap-gene-1.35 protein:Tk12382 transcript:maker-scaffold190_size271632-snap-gene-1.35-mRNA-1 annotation:"conserved hypothetical protein"